MKRKPKPKLRLAPKRDRDVAAMIANGLRNRIGPDDPAPPDAVVWDDDFVIRLLEHFAQYGTFNLDASAAAMLRWRREVDIPWRYRALRDAEDTYEIAVEKLAAEFKCSETTVRTLIGAATAKRGARF